ncbi:MAG: hypothetical protein JWO36_3055 [Myxococcales bacterium]|nr:hypothetical protein [Myxococcales bacterium]
MNKLLQILGLAVALATVSGCELYFGGHNDHGSGTWNYCGADGYYQCQGDSCSWVSSTCPSGSGSGSNACGTSSDCAAGCYCQVPQGGSNGGGVCEEGGFCTTDADCGTGFHCNTGRSSCEPTTTPPGCTMDSQCGTGTFCDVPTGQCSIGSCAGTITCNTAAPTCPTGQVPLIHDGCYTGGCFDTAMCGESPPCKAINDESNCLAHGTTCSAVYVGIGCKKPDGTACHSGDTNCTCQSFQWNSCADKGAARMLIEDHGVMIDASPLLLQ